MSRGIRVSEKHGVNPSMGVCFWCGEEDGTILLPGRLPGDVEAPRHMCSGYDPCDTCQDQFKQGILCIEVADCHRLGRPELIKRSGYAPTGRHLVVSREWVTRTVQPESLRDQILAAGKTLMTEGDFGTIFKDVIET